jgi:hypothetical protein
LKKKDNIKKCCTKPVVPKLFHYADHLKYFCAILVLREAVYRDSRTTWANLADHLWSAEQTLGNTALDQWFQTMVQRHTRVPQRGVNRGSQLWNYGLFNDVFNIECNKLVEKVEKHCIRLYSKTLMHHFLLLEGVLCKFGFELYVGAKNQQFI